MVAGLIATTAQAGLLSVHAAVATDCHPASSLATWRLSVTYDESVVVAYLARRQDLSLARWRTRTLPVGTT
jgi:hypothetical protein